MIKTDRNRMFESRATVVAESLKAAVDQMGGYISGRVQLALHADKARVTSVSVSEYPSNSIDGSFKVNVGILQADGAFSFEVPVVISAGKPVLSEATILTSFITAKDTHDKAPAVLTQTPIATMDVDLTKISAERHGELVVYSHPNLPNWAYHVPTATLTAENNRSIIASRLVSSIRGFCLSDFRLVAKLLQTSFALPMVHEINVEAAAVPADSIFGNQAQTEKKFEAEAYERNLLIHGTGASQAPATFFSEDDRRHQTESRIRQVVTPAIEAYVKKDLKGSQPKILAFDYSKSRVKTAGNLAGEVTAEVRFYSNMSIEDTSIIVAFDAKGAVDVTSIKKSPLAIKAEAQREADLKILSKEEADRQLDAYRKNIEANTRLAKDAGLAGINASSSGSLGSDLLNSPVADRIPMLKALLPADTKPGDKLNVRGYVYEICATDFNAPDVEHSAFWLLALTNELPSEKIPTVGVWG